MYRVELKVVLFTSYLILYTVVPNVPCGVESLGGGAVWVYEGGVPNVPCGVERLMEI